MVDEVGNKAEVTSAEPLIRRDQERADLYVSKFFRDVFPNQILEVDERTAREILESLPAWREEVKGEIRATNIPSAKHDLALVDSVTLEYIVDCSERKIAPAVDRIKHERPGPQKESLGREIRLWQSRQEATEMALSIQGETIPPSVE